ncbi:molybdenum cofactor guanylyltransferase [Parasegetibacter sp. NRK P23]|uniref:molybdenum cofactor guanylyltransferase n=1 Tax=Parasegetibacter sp. NRK P23 TaxID=2942999 RepID=UPI00204303CD|nr:NTP transferase domain-containing protein [Parasegetibacter sp. NRK P23]MCM5526946.1 NTP transferase domain-containing protein [Parasegetibacter sp. NRK P23]
MKPELLAAVLCGGFSTRMGRDKGLIPVRSTIQAKVVGGLSEALGLETVYAMRKEQEEAYSKYISPSKIILDHTKYEGPLQGLASVHDAFPDKDILLLACDMPEVKESTLRLLIKEYEKASGEFYAFYDGNFFQTFCAVYTSEGMRKWLKEDIFSLQRLLNTGSTKKIKVPFVEHFENFNGSVRD